MILKYKKGKNKGQMIKFKLYKHIFCINYLSLFYRNKTKFLKELQGKTDFKYCITFTKMICKHHFYLINKKIKKNIK